MVICVIFLGMAGSGKSTLMQRMNAQVRMNNLTPYCINLDPAVNKLSYPARIDIRDSINYKGVMQQHNLGPNGAILTCLNLFSTQILDIVSLIEKSNADIVLIDTPGQLEVFTWSASGQIITQCLKQKFPTVMLYVTDLVRNSSNPNTFVSNMLQSCGILYKFEVPLIICWNKIDLGNVPNWMTDIEALLEAIHENKQGGYLSDMSRSLCLLIEPLYRSVKQVQISAITGIGSNKLIEVILQEKEELLKQRQLLQNQSLQVIQESPMEIEQEQEQNLLQAQQQIQKLEVTQQQQEQAQMESNQTISKEEMSEKNEK